MCVCVCVCVCVTPALPPAKVSNFSFSTFRRGPIKVVCFLGEVILFIVHSHFDIQDLKHFHFLPF